MPQKLHDIEIDEISLVDDGANEGSRVVIVKSKQPPAPLGADSTSGTGLAAAIEQEFQMDIEQIAKALSDAESKLAELEQAVESGDAEIAKRDAEIAALKDEVEKAKKMAADKSKKGAYDGEDSEPDGDEDDDMKVKKALATLPEPVRKALEARASAAEEEARVAKARADAAEAEIAKARDAAELSEAIAKARSMGAPNAEEVGPLLLRVRKGKTTEADAKALESMLSAVAAQKTTAALFKSLGSADASDTDPEAVLKSKAEEIQKANSGMTFEQAYDKALSANPALYEAVSKRRRPQAA